MSEDPTNIADERTIIGDEAQHDFGDRFKVIRWLGRGGMGDVYLAMDGNLHRRVAIKVIRPDLSEDQEIRQRIERECLLHAKVGPHPNIVTLFDKLERGGEIQLVMEYVAGQTLRDYLDRHQENGTEPPRSEAFHITLQMLDALARIHAEGIVHRDIKPANVILAQDDNGGVCAKLMDFGIARLESGGSQFTNMIRTAVHSSMTSPGTPLYMAPEQFDSETFGPVSARTDVYAMGVVLYELLTGSPPFLGSLTEILRAHLNAPPPALRPASGNHVPEPLVSVVWTSLAKKPSDRFASAAAFRDTLMHLSEIESASLSEMAQLPQMDSDHGQKAKDDGDERLAPAGPARATESVAAVPKKRPAILARVSIAAAVLLVVLGIIGLAQVFTADAPPAEEAPAADQVTAAVEVPAEAVAATAGAVGTAAPEAIIPEAKNTEEAEAPASVLAAPVSSETPDLVGEFIPGAVGFSRMQSLPETLPPSQPPLAAASVDIVQQEAVTIGAVPMPIPTATHSVQQPAPDLPLNAPVVMTDGDASKPLYIVQPGDSLSAIAKQHNLDVYDLAVWNELLRPNDINVGDTIYLYKRPGLRPVTPQFSRQSTTPPQQPTDQTPVVAAPEPPAPAPPPPVKVEEEKRGVRQWFRQNVVQPLKSKERKR